MLNSFQHPFSHRGNFTRMGPEQVQGDVVDFLSFVPICRPHEALFTSGVIGSTLQAVTGPRFDF
jgi:hypothetical protein